MEMRKEKRDGHEYRTPLICFLLPLWIQSWNSHLAGHSGSLLQMVPKTQIRVTIISDTTSLFLPLHSPSSLCFAGPHVFLCQLPSFLLFTTSLSNFFPLSILSVSRRQLLGKMSGDQMEIFVVYLRKCDIANSSSSRRLRKTSWDNARKLQSCKLPIFRQTNK